MWRAVQSCPVAGHAAQPTTGPLAAAGAELVLAACGDDDDTAPATTGAPPGTVSDGDDRRHPGRHRCRRGHHDRLRRPELDEAVSASSGEVDIEALAGLRPDVIVTSALGNPILQGCTGETTQELAGQVAPFIAMDSGADVVTGIARTEEPAAFLGADLAAAGPQEDRRVRRRRHVERDPGRRRGRGRHRVELAAVVAPRRVRPHVPAPAGHAARRRRHRRRRRPGGHRPHVPSPRAGRLLGHAARHRARGAAIRDREITSRELLELYLDRIERLDPPSTPSSRSPSTGRRAEADAADARTPRAGPLPPLHGLPITIKDAIETAGIRSTGGAIELTDHVPAHDAPAVARLKAAGAIVFGKTNLPRWSGDVQSFNEIFGTTNNPWDVTRVPGGSSGGPAAAVAAGFTSFELGTDIGGSVRIPSHCCGTFGLKPSYGVDPAARLPRQRRRRHDRRRHQRVRSDGPQRRRPRPAAVRARRTGAGPRRPAWRLELPAPRVHRARRAPRRRLARRPGDAERPGDARPCSAPPSTGSRTPAPDVDEVRPPVDPQRRSTCSCASSARRSSVSNAGVRRRRSPARTTRGCTRDRDRARAAGHVGRVVPDYDALLTPGAVHDRVPHTQDGNFLTRELTVAGEPRPYLVGRLVDRHVRRARPAGRRPARRPHGRRAAGRHPGRHAVPARPRRRAPRRPASPTSPAATRSRPASDSSSSRGAGRTAVGNGIGVRCGRCTEGVADRSDRARRAWVAEAVRRIEADANRSADTHLIRFPLPATPGVDLYLKDESTHATGSLKHRLARSLFLYALCNGWLVEGTHGRRGVERVDGGLRGLLRPSPRPATSSPSCRRARRPEKIALIERQAAAATSSTTPAHVYARPQRLAAELGGHYIDQFTHAERATDWRGNNNIAESIFEQMRSSATRCRTWIVVGAGTGGTSATIGRYVRYRGHHDPAVRARPRELGVLHGWCDVDPPRTPTVRSRIEGIGRPRVEPSFVGQVIDRMIAVPDARLGRRHARERAPSLGRRVGAVDGHEPVGRVRARRRDARRRASGSIVTLVCDGGERYAHTTTTTPGWRPRAGTSPRPACTIRASSPATPGLPSPRDVTPS